MMKEKKIVLKGEIYWANIPVMKDSQIQAGIRPVVIWCNEKAGKFSPVVQYIPVTSRTEKMLRKNLPTHVLLDGYEELVDSVVLTEQLGCIDKTRLGDKICDLSVRDVFRITMASMIQQGVDVRELFAIMNNQCIMA